MKVKIRLVTDWRKALSFQLSAEYIQKLTLFLTQEKKSGKIIYPEDKNIFRAFSLTSLEKTKVVILGQDPYHGVGQAHGLCFSVLPNTKIPKSLINIYKELHNDLKIAPASHGLLESWALQGVLLLNSVLTVEKAKPASHQKKGWEVFTDEVIAILNAVTTRKIIFVLWGKYAQKKGSLIDRKRHIVLEAAHPSPFSAHKGFFGCQHFSKINKHLQSWGDKPIEWCLKDE